MQKTKRASKLVALAIAIMMLMATFSLGSFAAGYEDLAEGTYTVDAGLSAVVVMGPMGSFEFGAPLFSGATVTVDASGDAEMTLSFTKANVAAPMGQTAHAFIDNTSAASTAVQYSDGSTWHNATYTLSSDTALDSDSNAINYVDSITFPLTNTGDTFKLAIYVNSDVMGAQFGGAGSTRDATLTVDWTSAEEVKTADETTNQNATVTYDVTTGYEVVIPAIITVNPTTKVGEYEVEAQNFTIDPAAYVTVTADTAGSVANGGDSLAFTNVLEDAKLKASGDKLDGTVTVTDSATKPGTYTGTLDFTINYFAN